jgi:hypothetical protein
VSPELVPSEGLPDPVWLSVPRRFDEMFILTSGFISQAVFYRMWKENADKGFNVLFYKDFFFDLFWFLCGFP